MNHSRNTFFGGFVLNRARGCLEDSLGVERVLRPKSYLVLDLLAERCGRLVSKDELIEKAWPDVIASDDSLAHCVSDIRRALGPEGSALLRTVPRRGYMLVTSPAGDPPARGTPNRANVRPAGLAAAFVAAAAVLWWTAPHDTARVAPDVSDPALARADALLEARDWRRREDNETARELLEAAIAEDPGNSGAWAGLGLTYWLEVRHLAWGGGRREMARAFEMVERAVAIGDDARAHRLLAEMRLLAPFEEMRSPVDALANARAAVTIDPGDPANRAVLAQAFALTGRADEVVQTFERARRLDPDPPDWQRQVAGLIPVALCVDRFGPVACRD